MSLWSLAPCGILLVRRSSSSLSPLLGGLANSRLYLLLFPLRVGPSSFPTFRNSAPRRNPLLTPYLVPSVSGLYVTSWVPHRMSYPYVLCARSRFICIVLPRFLLVRGLFLSLLVLPLVLYPRMRLVSFSVVSFLFLSLLLCILLHPLLVLTAFVRSLLLLLFLAMFLSPLSLLPPLGVLLLSSLLSICVMSSSLPLLGFHWVLWWQRMRLFSILLCVGVGLYYSFVLFCGLFQFGSPVGFPSSSTLQYMYVASGCQPRSSSTATVAVVSRLCRRSLSHIGCSMSLW